ncbi:hypothetical protein D9758_004365 [Tetrapyrgos nigripes]|uniref:NAD(P)-binding protein n=1 Tax=Tetrapyrgos nigripes TaxID=182062 RepID=A0A8H5GNJ7_9AGAR|nr:hypothetical protein D9758_004365 [Tetrapyrgos nigripes]
MSLGSASVKSILKPLLVVGGVGKGSGTGSATSKLFARRGYDVALIARGKDALNELSEEINREGRGKATPFPTASYNPKDIQATFGDLTEFYRLPVSPQLKSTSQPQPTTHALRVALFNIGYPVFKSFLQTTDEDVKNSLEGNVQSAFAFSREVILRLRENEIEDRVEGHPSTSIPTTSGKGTLIFTGATASQRGNTMTSAFAAGKAANRVLSQSLAKEFGREGIHVVHAVIDGRIKTSSDSDFVGLSPESIAKAYWDVAHQERSAWTWELDLRPADEQW